jgi:hypothetical protein
MKAWAAGTIQTNITATHAQNGEAALEANYK